MTMPNGSAPAPKRLERGQHVAPGPVSFEVSGRLYNTPQGSVKMVVLRFETITGTTELVMAPEFAATVGQAMLKAGSGIEVVTKGKIL